MDTYKITKLKNGNILLTKILIDYENYTIINKKNGDKLLTKIKTIELKKVNEVKNYNFKKSHIINCNINNYKSKKLKYKALLKNVYELIGDGTKIIKNTKINIKTIKKNNEGFSYFPNLGISVQGVDSNKCLLEIINQCIKNKINLKMKINLKNGTLININL